MTKTSAPVDPCRNQRFRPGLHGVVLGASELSRFGGADDVPGSRCRLASASPTTAATGARRDRHPGRRPTVEDYVTSAARVRAASYITGTGRQGPEPLVFSNPAAPEAGTHLPGGGIEPGERPDAATIREAVEETGVQGSLDLRGVVGVQQGTYGTGDPCISIYFHLVTDEARDDWVHTMIGDEDAWDTGLQVDCRFAPITEAARLLQTSWHEQAEYVGVLQFR